MKQRIIISGHTGGIGKALAEHYLMQGSEVLGIARRTLLDAENLVQIQLDLSCKEELESWLESGGLADFLNGADEIVLINNAGTVEPSSIAGKQMPSEIAAAVQLNIASALILSDRVLALRQPKSRVKIAHISSGAGRKAYAGWSVYGATKAALDHHARCLAAEEHPNVAVASIAPGVVDTPMQALIRSQEESRFPLLDRFWDLKNTGGLSSAQDTAQTLAAMIAHEDFGVEVIQDVRTWQDLMRSFQTVSALQNMPSENE